jgi:hypothetical protein
MHAEHGVTPSPPPDLANTRALGRAALRVISGRGARRDVAT